MLHIVANYFATLPAVFIDGLIYVILAMNATVTAILSSDTARTLIGPVYLFWVTSINAMIGSGLLALKMFRSTAFADHQQDKKDKAAEAKSFQTEVFLKSQTQKLAQGKDNDIKTF